MAVVVEIVKKYHLTILLSENYTWMNEEEEKQEYTDKILPSHFSWCFLFLSNPGVDYILLVSKVPGAMSLNLSNQPKLSTWFWFVG